MVEAWLVIVVLAPVLSAVIAGASQHGRVAEHANLAAAIVCLIASLWLVTHVDGVRTFINGYVLFDALGAWTLVCTCVVYCLASIYAVGYMRLLREEAARLPGFYALFALFAATMICGPLMNNIGVYWIAIELTTLVSTFLVGFERGQEAIEAAWKYIIVVSAGISLALLGTVLFYWSGSLVLGPTYDMTWDTLRHAAPRMSPALTQMAFLLVLVGYGTKAGLAPMHTWLPDAHSEGPAPVSAMLSGALLNTAMLGVARFLTITDAASGSMLPRTVLVAFGAFSLLVAALFIVRQEGIKRLMAYSSVEHMGVLALGFGFGGPLAIAAVLYHMLNHSLNKSLMFFGAGNVMRVYGTKDIDAIRGVWSRFPVTGALWIAGAVAITGAPPFGLFLSELALMRAGFATPNAWAVIVLLLLLIVIFIGFLNHFRTMYFDTRTPLAAPAPVTNGVEVSTWMTLPMWMALLPVFVLGVWWPQALWRYFEVVAANLGGGTR
ncbi:NAD(P)H-quinone oxidoreductase subunit 2, chloroplastic [Paraburkholderia caffeinitolerans]|uniref:NAD(P)H-quinone oxidoreductase subunit 2, chloroplastic n=1 Tax=Paraburkholderia caffeinitolerans TaxID=1723730 RepID=A0A6J5G4W1_9BURK|nr:MULTISPECIES: proton-conducting transporter membrane subunit [Paraburkholderia]CAB3793689.1 NAD(P)H-quinone oxidoreductase subunit 2, chloroplastic [Paraburkholderia caffeinitolerans]